jgi:hypothetical protein
MGRWQDLDIVRDSRQVFFIYFSIESIPIELVLIAQPGTVQTETRANTVKMGIETGKLKEILEPRARVELATCRLRIGCSTTELPRPDSWKSF